MTLVKKYKKDEEEIKLCETAIKGESSLPMLIANTGNTTVKVRKGEELDHALPLRSIDRVRTGEGRFSRGGKVQVNEEEETQPGGLVIWGTPKMRRSMNKGPEKQEKLKINCNVRSVPIVADSSEWEEEEEQEEEGEISLRPVPARFRDGDRSEVDADKSVGWEEIERKRERERG